VEAIRENPIPSAMIGLGAAWLLAKRRSTADRYYAYRGSYGGGTYGGGSYRAGDVGGYDPGSGAVGTRGVAGSEQASTLGSQAREAIGDLAGRAHDAASDVRDAARRTSRRAQLRFNDVLENNPLVLGVAAALIGAVVGMSVPSTEAENHLMGDARDAVVDRAREMASTAADRVSDAAGNVEQLAAQVKDQSKDLAR
jgi:ElaB/YqjD/DUF883 family membrane-anchored ribosome-binding protein